MLLMLMLGVPASTLALPTDVNDIDLDAPRTSTPSTPSLWHQPAPPPTTLLVGPPPRTSRQADQRTPDANPLWAIPLAKLSNTRARPIFSSSRRPPPTAVTTAPAVKATPSPPQRVERPELSLVGTVVGDDTSLGVFIDPATQTALRLKIGDDFQGWKLHSVQGREVTFTHDKQAAVLSLPQPDAAKATGAAMPDNTGNARTQSRTAGNPPLQRRGRR